MSIQVAVFHSMLSAVAFCLGTDADRAFWVEDARRRHVNDLISEIPDFTPAQLAEPNAAGIASTFVDWAMETDVVAGFQVRSDIAYGTILAHYTKDGDPIRFVVLKA